MTTLFLTLPHTHTLKHRQWTNRMHEGQAHIQSVSLCKVKLEVKFAQGVLFHCLNWTAALLLKEEETKANISQYRNVAR